MGGASAPLRYTAGPKSCVLLTFFNGRRFVMIKTAAKENYGTPLLRNLVKEAGNLGLVVSFYKDMEGKYIIIYKSLEYVLPRKAGAASACWFLRGLISMAKSQLRR